MLNLVSVDVRPHNHKMVVTSREYGMLQLAGANAQLFKAVFHQNASINRHVSAAVKKIKVVMSNVQAFRLGVNKAVDVAVQNQCL